MTHHGLKVRNLERTILGSHLGNLVAFAVDLEAEYSSVDCFRYISRRRTHHSINLLPTNLVIQMSELKVQRIQGIVDLRDESVPRSPVAAILDI